MQPAYITFSMYYSIMKSNALKVFYEKELSFKYDYVIRARFDLQLDFDLSLTEFDNNFLYFHNDCPNPNGMNDQFAISSSDNMNVYSSLFYKIDHYWVNDGVTLSNELLLKWHLLKNEISLRPFSFRSENKPILWGR